MINNATINKPEEHPITLFNVSDLKKIFKCGHTYAYSLVNTKGFPSIRIGGRIMVEKNALEKWLEMNKGKRILLA